MSYQGTDLDVWMCRGGMGAWGILVWWVSTCIVHAEAAQAWRLRFSQEIEPVLVQKVALCQDGVNQRPS
jgi:hypothetical protein